jgi:hypothetical protein
MSWDLRLRAPIAVLRGKPLVTLRDAATHITTLPARPNRNWPGRMLCMSCWRQRTMAVPSSSLGWEWVQVLYPKPPPVYHSVKKDPASRNARKLVRDR